MFVELKVKVEYLHSRVSASVDVWFKHKHIQRVKVPIYEGNLEVKVTPNWPENK